MQPKRKRKRERPWDLKPGVHMASGALTFTHQFKRIGNLAALIDLLAGFWKVTEKFSGMVILRSVDKSLI